jgi:hypothetical protein
VSVLSDVGEPEAHIIQEVMPHHIVNPNWLRLKPGEDLIGQWLFIETLARLLVIWLTWLVIVRTIDRRYKKRSQSELDITKMPPG